LITRVLYLHEKNDKAVKYSTNSGDKLAGQGENRDLFPHALLVGIDTTYPTARITIHPTIRAICFPHQGQVAGYATHPPPCPGRMEGRASPGSWIGAKPPRRTAMFGLCQGKSLDMGQAHRSGLRSRPPGVPALPVTHEGDCRDHRARGGQEDSTASGEGWSPPSRIGSRFA